MKYLRFTMFLSCLAGSAAAREPWAARFAAERCEFDKALAILDLEKPETSEQWQYAILRARLLLQTGRPKEALAAMEVFSSVTMKPQEADRLFVMGMALGLEGQFRPAIDLLRRAEGKGIDASLIDGAVGMAYLKAEKPEDAEKALLRALKITPTLTGAIYNLACLRAKQGRITEAAALLREAWHLGYKDPAKLSSDPSLSAVRAEPDLIRDLLTSTERACGTY